MSYLIDLHTHTTCSDGQLSPTDLVALAKANRVDVLAITDHDTLSGIEEAKAAAGNGIHIVSGIEFSALWQGRNIHIVGLNFDTNSHELQKSVAQQGESRLIRAKAIAQKLEKAGLKGIWEGAQQYAKGVSIGRPHFAQYMVDSGQVDSFAKAFKQYLGNGKIGDLKQHWPDVTTVVKWITQAGGVAVLAHPDRYGLTRTKLYALLKDFTDSGGLGIEVVSGQQLPAVTSKLVRAALDFSLLMSCGSDFHSESNKWQSPGKMATVPVGYKAVWDDWDIVTNHR